MGRARQAASATELIASIQPSISNGDMESASEHECDDAIDEAIETSETIIEHANEEVVRNAIDGIEGGRSQQDDEQSLQNDEQSQHEDEQP